MSRPVLIMNPEAGSVRDDPRLLTQLQAHPNLERVELVLATGPGSMESAARDAREEGKERVIVAGGDGSVHEVVNGLLDGLDPEALPSPGDLPLLCVLPMGTGNDLARSLGLPLDPWKAAADLDWSRVLTVDLIHHSGDQAGWCVNVISGGLASPAPPGSEEPDKKAPGVLAYWRRGAEAVARPHPSYRMTLVMDEEEELTLEAQNVVIGNGRFVAGGIPVTPEARLDDGLLELLVVPEMDVGEMTVLFPRLLLGKHHEDEAILSRRVRRVTLRSEPALDLSLDGEAARAETMEIRVVPGALRMVTGTEGS